MNKDQTNNYSLEYIMALKILTPRQIEVLDGVAVGRTSREIGQELNISHRTVEKYCEQLRKKLGLRGYRSLFHWCEEHVNGRES